MWWLLILPYLVIGGTLGYFFTRPTAFYPESDAEAGRDFLLVMLAWPLILPIWFLMGGIETLGGWLRR